MLVKLFANETDIVTLGQVAFAYDGNCQMKGHISFVVFHPSPKKKLYTVWAFSLHLKILGSAPSLEIRHL